MFQCSRPGARTEHGVAAVSPPPPAPLPPGYPGMSSLGVGKSRRSSCGTLSPMASSVPASVQKLKRMFTEPEKPDNHRVTVTPPPLSPDPTTSGKTKPTTFLNRQRLLPQAASRAPSDLAESPSPASGLAGGQAEKPADCVGGSTAAEAQSPSNPAASTGGGGGSAQTLPHVTVREYRQTSY